MVFVPVLIHLKAGRGLCVDEDVVGQCMSNMLIWLLIDGTVASE
jgi:hypothetical protein